MTSKNTKEKLINTLLILISVGALGFACIYGYQNYENRNNNCLMEHGKCAPYSQKIRTLKPLSTTKKDTASLNINQ